MTVCENDLDQRVHRMGIAAMQLGIKDEAELAEMARFYTAGRYRMFLAKSLLGDAVRLLDGAS